jgi:hypothetical protein
MPPRLALAAFWVAALLFTFAVTPGCDLITDQKTPDSPTQPTPPGNGSIEPFTGSFSSSSTGTPSATSCTNLKYTVSPTSASAANVTFSATCASNIQINGSGSGAVSGTTLNWNAQGTVTQGSLTCPFTFPNGSGNTAVQEPAGGIRVNYSGTICGIAVTGSDVVKK